MRHHQLVPDSPHQLMLAEGLLDGAEFAGNLFLPGYKRLPGKQVGDYQFRGPDFNLPIRHTSGGLTELHMEINQTLNRIHPLMAGAAVSVMLVSLLGVAAIAGVLPNSHGNAAETAQVAQAAQTAAVAPISAPVQQVAAAPVVVKEAVEHKTVVHHQYVQHRATPAHLRQAQIAQAEPVRQYSQAPAYQQPAPVAHNSPVGIGIGAVVGGLLGHQVGGGNGRILATIAGAVGGGYVGNEIAQRNP